MKYSQPPRDIHLGALALALLLAGAGLKDSTVPASPAVQSVKAAAGGKGSPRFRNVAGQLGVAFNFFNDFRPDRFFLPEVMGGGVAWIDFDGDGWLDLYLVNGCTLPYDSSDRSRTSQLFRSQSAARFAPVQDLAGAEHTGYGQGAAVGDLDNDGFDDLLVTCYGENTLYRNNGDGTFRDCSLESGIQKGGRWHTSAAFGDLDRDGDLDLYIAGYVQTTLETNPQCFDKPTNKIRVYCGPASYEAEEDFLFQNDGEGGFLDVTQSARGRDEIGKGLGVVIADLDRDGWPDIFVANDMSPEFLLRNRGEEVNGLRFDETGLNAGVAVNGDGRPIAGMGVTCGDYNADGWPDLLVTNFFEQGSVLFQNLKGRVFLDRSGPTGIRRLSYQSLGFGTGFIDYDLDGWLDLFCTNGHVLGPAFEPNWMRPQLFQNLAGKRFEEVSNQAGEYFAQKWLGRGAAFGDFDNDGAEDIAVVHHDRPAALLRNETPQRGHFLQVRLTGLSDNRSAVGSRVTVHVGDRTLMREIVGGGSYLSASDRRLLFGLGNFTGKVSVDIEWPDGTKHRHTSVPPDQLVEIRQVRPAT